MANTSSAKKANRVAQRRHVHNLRRLKAMKDAVKKMGKLTAGKDGKGASAHLGVLYQAIDKAHKRGIIHGNTAARMKSHAAKALATISK